MRPRWRRWIPEPLAELARPLLHPDPDELAATAADLDRSDFPTATRLRAWRRRLASVTRVQPAISPRARRAEQELQKLLVVGSHGSLTAGRIDWEQRWNGPCERRILTYAFKDYAGSLYDWTAALNDIPGVAARHCVVETSKFGFPVDLVYATPRRAPGVDGLIALAAEADIIHVKDEFAFDDPVRREIVERLRKLGRPVVFTQYGGYARSRQDDPAYRRFVTSFDGHVGLTADLCFDWLPITHVPHALPVDAVVERWSDGHSVAHSPSTPVRKGTDLLLEAIARLSATKIELDLITGVSVGESVRRKREATVFFDQAGRESTDRLGTDRVIGWYGKSAIEAMVAGIPVVAHLSDRAKGAADPLFMKDCPIIDVAPTADAIEAALCRFFDAPAEEREDLSRRSAEWVRHFHSREYVAGRLMLVYNAIEGPR